MDAVPGPKHRRGLREVCRPGGFPAELETDSGAADVSGRGSVCLLAAARVLFN